MGHLAWNIYFLLSLKGFQTHKYFAPSSKKGLFSLILRENVLHNRVLPYQISSMLWRIPQSYLSYKIRAGNSVNVLQLQLCSSINRTCWNKKKQSIALFVTEDRADKIQDTYWQDVLWHQMQGKRDVFVKPSSYLLVQD